MSRIIAIYSLVLAVTISQKTSIVSASCQGCVELDEISFDKLINHFKYSLVKFDIAFPYGEKHETYGEFAKKHAAPIQDLLVSLVGVKDYGEKENRALAQRFQVDDKAYPEIILFINGQTDNYIKYPKDWTVSVDNLKRFVSLHTSIYIPLDGCLAEFDKLSLEFPQKSIDQQRQLLDVTRKQLETLNDEAKERASIYVRIMEKIIEKGGSEQFIIDERKRVAKLLNEKISELKKKQLTYRQNILQSFQTTTFQGDGPDDTKDEL